MIVLLLLSPLLSSVIACLIHLGLAFFTKKYDEENTVQDSEGDN